MVAHINTIAFRGIHPVTVDVQVHMCSGQVAFSIVGLPDKAVKESQERIRSALNSIGLSLPPSRITVNMAPADLEKEGTHYDLPIAIGLLVEMKVIPADQAQGYLAIGELSLDGSITAVNGALPAAIDALSKDLGLICPKANGAEASWAGDALEILAPSNLLALINHFKGSQVLTPPLPSDVQDAPTYPDMKDIKGQETARRALEIAAAGGHNLLMNGPPGAGKSMLAARLPGIIPELDASEMLDVSMIASVAGHLPHGSVSRARPYRSPHHSCSMPAMVGGGKRALPGEITLAHHGVLFLDELPEFPRTVLDSLRQPLEAGIVTIARAHAHVTYPARFQLVAAMNPCRCGHLSDAARACNKAPRCAKDYQSKISGPMLDRFDIHIDVPAVTPMALSNHRESETSEHVARRVAAARERQKIRYQGSTIRLNAQLDGALLEQAIPLTQEQQIMMHDAYEKMKLSMRGYQRILRVARTIADLEANDNIENHHLAEALTYRHIAAYKA